MTLAETLINYKAIKFGDFNLAHGGKSNYYIDIKSVSTNPTFLYQCASTIAESYNFDAIAGVAVGGVPLAVLTSFITTKPYVIIRSKFEYRTKDILIGDVKDKDVLLVEDVITTGESSMYGVRILRESGAKVDTVVAVVDREQGAEKLLKSYNVDLFSMVKMSEVLKKITPWQRT